MNKILNDTLYVYTDSEYTNIIVKDTVRYNTLSYISSNKYNKVEIGFMFTSIVIIVTAILIILKD